MNCSRVWLVALVVVVLATVGGSAASRDVSAAPESSSWGGELVAPLSQIWYVKPDGNNANDCLSPDTACATLAGPLAKPEFMPGDTIRAAVGVYAGETGREAVVSVPQDAVFSGGWDATAFTAQQGLSEVDGRYQLPYGFQLSAGVKVTIDHFDIRHCGAGAAIILRETGAVSVVNSTLKSNMNGIDAYGLVHVRVFDSVVRENSGVGIFVSHYFSEPGGSLLVDNSTVESNMFGGISSSGTTTITHSLIARNTGGNAAGAGIRVGENSTITDNQIISNTSQWEGGGIGFYGGPKSGVNVYIARNEIRDNVAQRGGGLYLGLDSGPTTTTVVEGNRIVGNRTMYPCGGGVLIDGRGGTLQNNLIADNIVGGGICTEGGNTGESWIVNNTIVNNQGDGILITNPFSTVMHLVNNIIAGNTNRGIVGWNNDPQAQTVNCNLVWGNSNGNYVGIQDFTGLNGNISQAPVLVDRIGGPWHLGQCSPARDAGTDLHAPSFDYDGDPRPHNGRVDIGADEYVDSLICYRRYLPMIRR